MPDQPRPDPEHPPTLAREYLARAAMAFYTHLHEPVATAAERLQRRDWHAATVAVLVSTFPKPVADEALAEAKAWAAAQPTPETISPERVDDEASDTLVVMTSCLMGSPPVGRTPAA